MERKYSNKYQCLWEQQDDFLLDSSCWLSETDEGVKFLDYSETGRNLETHATLHQWRTYTMKDEIICLQQCLENLHFIIPAYKVRIKNSRGKINFILLNTLEYFRNMNWNIWNKWNTEWKRCQFWGNHHIWRKSQHNTLTKPKSKTKSSITKIMQRVSINTTKK